MEIKDYLDNAKKHEGIFRQIVAGLAPRDRFNKLSSPSELFDEFSAGERNGEFTIYDFYERGHEGEFVIKVRNANPGSGVVEDIVYRVHGNILERKYAVPDWKAIRNP